jgi:hypothetical protein
VIGTFAWLIIRWNWLRVGFAPFRKGVADLYHQFTGFFSPKSSTTTAGVGLSQPTNTTNPNVIVPPNVDGTPQTGVVDAQLAADLAAWDATTELESEN